MKDRIADWVWEYEGYDPDKEKLRESLCALGNGYVVTRGAAPNARRTTCTTPGRTRRAATTGSPRA